MAKTADDLIEIPSDEIQLGHDADGMPKVVAGEATATGAPIESEADDRLETLQKERDELARDKDRFAAEAATERAARTAAEERAAKTGADLDTRTQQAVRAHVRSVTAEHQQVAAEHQQITSAISSHQQLADAAERELQAAMTEGDHAKAAKAQRELSRAEATLLALEQGRYGIEARVAETKRTLEDTERRIREGEPAPERKQDAQPKTVEPLSAEWIAGSPKATQPWLTTHKAKLANDPRLLKRVMNFAEGYALEKGDPNALDNPSFVRALDEKFFPKDEDMHVSDDNEEEVAETPKPKAKKVAAAPVSRGGAVFSSNNMDAKAVRDRKSVV